MATWPRNGPLTNPVPSALVPYDLEAPAHLIWPCPTPLRTIPRVQGSGLRPPPQSHFRRNRFGTGGVTSINPGIAENANVTRLRASPRARPRRSGMKVMTSP